MSDATTPANPTDQVAAVVATPAVVQDAQRYDWRKDIRGTRWAVRTEWAYIVKHDRLAAYIERLETERDALLAEHEAVKPGIEWGEFSDTAWDAAIVAYDNAERVIHGEQDS